jgi:hypothetical protein
MRVDPERINKVMTLCVIGVPPHAIDHEWSLGRPRSARVATIQANTAEVSTSKLFRLRLYDLPWLE